MKNIFLSALQDSIDLKTSLVKDSQFASQVEAAATKLRQIVRGGGTIYVCGNGGSACDAMHLCEELVARYKRERPGIKAMHFIDPGTLTCWANDYDYEGVFERPVKTFCSAKDVLVLISTSGNSVNVNKAAVSAKEQGCYTIALSGKSGGELAKLADLSIVVPGEETARIQEVHILLIHVFCECLEAG